MFKGIVEIVLKPGVVDPPGVAIKESLHSLGFNGVESVQMGKRVEVQLRAADRKEAEEQLQKICEQLLVNPVIEEYTFSIEGEA